jgi:hypothetical protein
MDNPLIVALISIVGTLVVVGVVLFLLSGSNSGLGLGLRALGRAVREPTFADQLRPLLTPPPPKEQAPPKPSGVPLRVLALLQREGRLLDFLLEDIGSYQDAQVGAAVRDIHQKCQAALREHLTVEPVLPQAEGSSVEVPAGFDPSAIRLVGNVTGQPPFRGTLLHPGWRVREFRLAPPPEGQDELVLMPAEVEL